MRPDLPAVAALFALEACLVILAIGTYKKGERTIVLFVTSRAGGICLLALAGLAVALVVLVSRHRIGRVNQEGFRLAVALNLMSLAAGLGTGELLIRMISSRTPNGTTFRGMRLLPREWHEVTAHYREILRKASVIGSYLVFDPTLGWDVGRNRASEDGLYFSSVEGIRSARAGERFAGSAARSRVALVGDSFTFGLEVTYEESWGYQLERKLGESVQVLNFGVDGYGVDQAYLKYRQRVRVWRPDVVIFSVIDHDIERAMGVYAFLTFPGAPLPFPKPRMVVDRQGLTTINMPLPRPEEIFSTSSIGELPFIRFDQNYDPWQWERHYYQHSYLVRFLESRFPRWPLPRPVVSDEEKRRLNGELLRSFVRDAFADRAIPVVVYFPNRTSFENPVPPEGSSAMQILRAANISYLDMTDCVSRVELRDRFLIRHYSRVANAAVARCLRDVVRNHLTLLCHKIQADPHIKRVSAGFGHV